MIQITVQEMLDILKTIFTYTIALVVIVGGGLLLIVQTTVEAAQLLPFLTSVIGSVITFVFQERSYAARESARLVEQQITSTTPPNVR